MEFAFLINIGMVHLAKLAMLIIVILQLTTILVSYVLKVNSMMMYQANVSRTQLTILVLALLFYLGVLAVSTSETACNV
jgi:hypothetical protein